MKKFMSPVGNPQEHIELTSRSSSLDSFIKRFTGMAEESYFFYNGTVELRLDRNHKYWRVGELSNLIPVNGVTDTTHIINISERLVPWSAKVCIAKLLRLIPTETVDGILRIKPLTLEEFTVIALEAKSAHKDRLDEAADIGHLAHKCLEESIEHAIKNDPEHIVRVLINLPQDELATNAANGAKSWMDQHNVRWIETEAKIYSRTYDYAGTMDGLATCDSCQDKACCPEPFKDRLSLIDWKSSNYLNVGYRFQAASYKHAKQEDTGINIVDTWILRLGKNEDEAGKFEPWHLGPEDFTDDFAGFLACLNLTRLVDKVEERMSTQKNYVKSIRKEQKATAKALAKEQEKLAKAIAKAEAKKEREAEKAKIKADAKAAREAAKNETKAIIAEITKENTNEISSGTTQ